MGEATITRGGIDGKDATINGENVVEIIDSDTVVVDISEGKMQFNTIAGMRESIYIEATYTELEEIVSNNHLTPNAMYVLTDYQTKYRMPYVRPMVIKTVETTERLVLRAVSGNQFDIQCSSLDYPNDIIYYDFENNTCEDDETPRKGFIQRRIDTVQKIDVPQDWRTMTWARFRGTGQTWSGTGYLWRGSIYQSGMNLYIATRNENVVSIDITNTNFFQKIGTIDEYLFTGVTSRTGLSLDLENYAERYTFNSNPSLTVTTPSKNELIPPINITMRGGSFLKTRESNSAKTELRGLHNNVFHYTASYDFPSNISLEEGCHSNTLGSACYDIEFGTNCYDNICRIYFQRNRLLSSCYSNIFGNYMRNCFFGNQSYGNVVGNSCGSIFWESVVYENYVGDNCEGLKFSTNCFYNNFGNNCKSNTLSDTCSENVFGTGCTNNIMENNCSRNKFANNLMRLRMEREISGKDMTSISALYFGGGFGNVHGHRRIFQVNSVGFGQEATFLQYYTGNTIGTLSAQYVLLP